MTNQTAIKTTELLESYIINGARKNELYQLYKVHGRRVVRAEILEVLMTARDIDEAAAKRVWTLKGSEVKELQNRLG